MKKRMTALLTTLLLALALCVPALAAIEYGVFYDETEQLGSVELSYAAEQTLPRLTQELGVDLRVDAFTDEDVDADTSEMCIRDRKNDELIGSFVDIGEAAREVGNICNAYNAIDIDFTVLLTHIGFEDVYKRQLPHSAANAARCRKMTAQK